MGKSAFLAFGCLGLCIAPGTLLAADSPPRAAVFSDKLPGCDEALAREIANQVSASGYAVEFVGITTITNTTAVSANQFDLLVLPGARSLPAEAAPAIESFLKQGGDLLALGLPAWDSPLFELNGRWISTTAMRAVYLAFTKQRRSNTGRPSPRAKHPG